MTPAEVAKTLRFISSVDGRPVEDSDIAVWHLILEPISYERAQAAVLSHFRHKPDVWIKPGHIWEGAKTTTDGESRDAAPVLALKAECDHGSFCTDCKSVHHANESCDVLVKAPDGMAGVVDMFRPPALTTTTAERVDPPADLTPAEAGALEAECRRQLAALAAMGEGETA